MTKKIFEEGYGDFSVVVSGKYPTHSVVGTPTDFYVYVKDNWEPWSKWIKGNSKLYFQLKKSHAGIFRSGAVVEAGVRLGFNPPDTFRSPNPNVLKRLLECLDLPVEASIIREIAMAKGAY